MHNWAWPVKLKYCRLEDLLWGLYTRKEFLSLFVVVVVVIGKLREFLSLFVVVSPPPPSFFLQQVDATLLLPSKSSHDSIPNEWQQL